MSKEGRWTIGFGAGTLILTAIGTWMAVMHENEHQEGIAAVVITILAGASLLALNGYSIHRNLRDAHRCKNIQRNIDEAQNEVPRTGNRKKICRGSSASVIPLFPSSRRFSGHVGNPMASLQQRGGKADPSHSSTNRNEGLGWRSCNNHIE